MFGVVFGVVFGTVFAFVFAAVLCIFCGSPFCASGSFLLPSLDEIPKWPIRIPMPKPTAKIMTRPMMKILLPLSFFRTGRSISDMLYFLYLSILLKNHNLKILLVNIIIIVKDTYTVFDKRLSSE